MNKKESKAGMVDPKPDQSQNQRKAEHSQLTISEEEATKSMPGKVSGATAQDLRMKLEQNDGIQRYEEDLNYEGKEYDVEIDASTGTFLEWIEEGAG